MNIYIELTNRFNDGGLRAILSSGQAVVLHRLAIMSKDGDWIVKENDAALNHILSILDEYGARYRFGAPLDKGWLSGGWSAHFEFIRDSLRIRTDFVSRPPRLSAERLANIWIEQKKRAMPFVDLVDLAELKKTNREKDYAVIGELSRKMVSIEDTVRYSRSARDLFDLYAKTPAIVISILLERGMGKDAFKAIETLEAALDAERRRLMHANENRLLKYLSASQAWSGIWKEVEKEIAGLSLMEAHKIIVKRAEVILPKTLPEEQHHA
jgi:hypothetical protein